MPITYNATFKVSPTGWCLPTHPESDGDSGRPWRVVQVREIPVGTPLSSVLLRLNRTAILGRLGTPETNSRVAVRWPELGPGKILRQP